MYIKSTIVITTTTTPATTAPARRFYSNTYTDAEKQDAINLFLGQVGGRGGVAAAEFDVWALWLVYCVRCL
jgi:hypothetical protein